MTQEVESVSISQPFSEVVACMASRAISCVLVCEKERPIGIVTERDIVGVLDKLISGGALPATVGDVMSCPVMTILETATVHEMMLRVEQAHVRRVVVVDSAGAVQGLVTQSDMLRAHAWDLDIAQQTVRYLSEITPKVE